MGSFRQQQVAEMVRRHFSQVLQQEGRYLFDDALVTVTSVKMTSDLGLAKIYLSVYNTDDKQSLVLMMEEEKPRLRQALATRIRKHVRRIPDVDFYLDDTLDEMYRLNALFDRLHADNQMGSEEE
ncbi:MAG: 30S ribosome-binding factor RbfA [Saprospiraceae bacterium]|nr:30S ribosome-binding factor RbfA [Saprospiraceae bacterium]